MRDFTAPLQILTDFQVALGLFHGLLCSSVFVLRGQKRVISLGDRIHQSAAGNFHFRPGDGFALDRFLNSRTRRGGGEILVNYTPFAIDVNAVIGDEAAAR